MNDDTDDRFKYILIAGVAILVVSCTVGIVYAVTAQGIQDDCTCPSWSCTTGFYVNTTGQCLRFCPSVAPFMNTTMASPTAVSGNCWACDTDM